MNKTKENRYFIIFYMLDFGERYGGLSARQHYYLGSSYPNIEAVSQQLRNKVSRDYYTNVSFTGITNIIEVSHNDYYENFGKPKPTMGIKKSYPSYDTYICDKIDDYIKLDIIEK